MRVLVVEDQKKIVSFIKKGLEEEGMIVDACEDGDEGYALATTEPYDALVLDIMLPGRDGLSILKNLRKQKNPVLKLLLFAGPMALLASAIGGWLVASHAMKPVTTITDTASRITTRDLNDRIPAKRGEFLEFANLVSVLNGMMDRLEKGFTHAVRFSGDVSHELKTPLTIMQAELNSALKRCEPGSEEEESLRVI